MRGPRTTDKPINIGGGRIGYPTERGKSLIEQIWEELDKVMDVLMKDGRDSHPITRGTAVGLGTALAILCPPDYPTLDAVRAESMARWERRHPARKRRQP